MNFVTIYISIPQAKQYSEHSRLVRCCLITCVSVGKQFYLPLDSHLCVFNLCFFPLHGMPFPFFGSFAVFLFNFKTFLLPQKVHHSLLCAAAVPAMIALATLYYHCYYSICHIYDNCFKFSISLLDCDVLT